MARDTQRRLTSPTPPSKPKSAWAGEMKEYNYQVHVPQETPKTHKYRRRHRRVEPDDREQFRYMQTTFSKEQKEREKAEDPNTMITSNVSTNGNSLRIDLNMSILNTIAETNREDDMDTKSVSSTASSKYQMKFLSMVLQKTNQSEGDLTKTMLPSARKPMFLKRAMKTEKTKTGSEVESFIIETAKDREIVDVKSDTKSVDSQNIKSRLTDTFSAKWSIPSQNNRHSRGVKVKYADYIKRTSSYSCHEVSLSEAGYRDLRKSAKTEISEEQDSEEQRNRENHIRHENKVKESRRQNLVKKKINMKDIVNDAYTCYTSEKVDCIPILKYLKTVQDNPDLYLRMNAEKQSPRDKTLVGLGKAYSRPYQKMGRPESLVVQAAYELGAKHQHPSTVSYIASKTTPRDFTTKLNSNPKLSSMVDMLKKPPHLRVQVNYGNIAPSKKKTEDLRSVIDTGMKKKAKELKVSDLENQRSEVEHWISSLTTREFIKARELAIKTMNEEDSSIRKWWVSQRFCRYLRKRKPGQNEMENAVAFQI